MAIFTIKCVVYSGYYCALYATMSSSFYIERYFRARTVVKANSLSITPYFSTNAEVCLETSGGDH